MGLFGKKEELNKEAEEEEEEDENTYEMEYECDNCEYPDTYFIPKGTTVEKYLADKICDNCGCKIVQEE